MTSILKPDLKVLMRLSDTHSEGDPHSRIFLMALLLKHWQKNGGLSNSRYCVFLLMLDKLSFGEHHVLSAATLGPA